MESGRAAYPDHKQIALSYPVTRPIGVLNEWISSQKEHVTQRFHIVPALENALRPSLSSQSLTCLCQPRGELQCPSAVAYNKRLLRSRLLCSLTKEYSTVPTMSGEHGTGRPKTAVDDSHNEVAVNSSMRRPISSNSDRVRQPTAQQVGPSLSSAALDEEVPTIFTQRSDTEVSFSRKRSSEDVNSQEPTSGKRDRKAEGLPPDYCFQCEEEHPWPDEDGTTHHTRPQTKNKRRRAKKRRYEDDEPAQENSAPATQVPVQQPPRTVLEAIERDPSIGESWKAASRETDRDDEKNALFLSLFDDVATATHPWAQNVLAEAARAPPVSQTATTTWRAVDHELSRFEWPAQDRSAIASQESGRRPGVDFSEARERNSSIRESLETPLLETDNSAQTLTTLVSLYNGTYREPVAADSQAVPPWNLGQFQPPNQHGWSPQPPRGRRGGRRGRGGGRGGSN